jgi:WD40 repeat protein
MKLPSSLQQSKHFSLVRVLGDHHLRPHGQTRALLFCADNKHFWSASDRLSLWSVETGELKREVAINASSIGLYKRSLLALDSRGMHLIGSSRSTKIHSPPRDGRCHYATFSDDGEALIAGSFTRRIWRADGTARKGSISGAGYQNEQLSPDGKSIFFFYRKPFLMTLSGKTLWILDIEIEILCANFLDPGTILATTRDGELLSLSAANGFIHWRKKLSDKRLLRPVSSARYIAVDDQENIYVLSHNGTLVKTIDGNKIADSHHIALSPNGEWLVVCDNREQLRIFRLPSGQEWLSKAGHSSRVVGLGWTSPNQVMSLAQDDPMVRRWYVTTGENTWMTELPGKGRAMQLSPDRQSFFVEWEHPGGIAQYELSTGDLIRQYQTPALLGAWGLSRDGQWLIAAVRDHTPPNASVYAFHLQDTTAQWTIPGNYYRRLKGLFFTHDNLSIWIFAGGSATRHTLNTGEQTLSCKPNYREEYDGAQLLRDGVTAIGNLSVLDDSGYFPEAAVRRWDIETNKLKWNRPEAYSQIHMSHDETWMVARGYQRFSLLSALKGKKLDEIDLHSLDDYITSTAMSSDDTMLAIGTDRGVILIYRVNPDI